MRAARFKMSVDLLRDLMHLPPNASIVGASTNGVDPWVTFVVDDPSLPEAEEPHESLPTCTRKEIVWSWNVDESGFPGITQ